MFPDNRITGPESEITNFTERKTGLFIPFWMTDLVIIGLRLGRDNKADFEYSQNAPFIEL
jgi:hypothetical protein